jgi:hypothetical protein
MDSTGQGLTTTQCEIVTAYRRTTIEVVRIRITDTGRMALES